MLFQTEKVIYSQVYSYMQLYLNPLLYGFWQVHGIQHVLFRLLQACQKELDKSGCIVRAYDCLARDLIIAKLEAYGFDISVKLFSTQVSNRKQRVKIGSGTNERVDILNEIHNVLFLALLYLISFINDLIM